MLTENICIHYSLVISPANLDVKVADRSKLMEVDVYFCILCPRVCEDEGAIERNFHMNAPW